MNNAMNHSWRIVPLTDDELLAPAGRYIPGWERASSVPRIMGRPCVATLDMPGVDPADVSVVAAGRTITVAHGERAFANWVQEFSADLDVSRALVQLNHGRMTICVPELPAPVPVTLWGKVKGSET